METQGNDKNLQQFVKRLKEDLEDAYKDEVSAQVTNPLKYAVELMALDMKDLDEWMTAFEKMDKEKEGYVSIDQIFEYIEETPTEIAKEVFLSADAIDTEGNIEFGDFMRAVGIFCLFGKDEVVK